MIEEENSFITKRASTKRVFFVSALLVFFAITSILLLLSFATTSPLTEGQHVTLQVDRGMSVQDIALEAKERNLVRSSLLLYGVLTHFHDPTAIYAGTYSFDRPFTVFEVGDKLASKEIDNTLLRVTIPEGTTRKEIAKIAKQKIESFNEITFLEETKNNEGYLFPDTYFVSPDFSAEEFVNLLTSTFSHRLAPYKAQIENSGFTEYEVLILASIIEREANDENSMRTVSGILQNRLKLGMALQTDASIEYVLDKPLSELSPEDLKLDTPYNTYLYPGLPPTPIGNPGLLAIKAVLEPIPTEYLFYITGDDGLFYYAETFEDHKHNIERYLR